MKHAVPLTDQKLSLSAREFVWDTDGSTAAHDYLFGPVVRSLTRIKARTVLDLGCGNGSFTALLAQSGFHTDGCDSSFSGIEIARRQHPELSFWHQDLAIDGGMNTGKQYDAVVSTEVIEHLLLPRQLMAAAIASLRPGGLFVVSTPYHGYLKNLALALTNKFDDHWHPLRDYGHVKFFSRKTLTSLFHEFGFHTITYESVGRVPWLARSMVLTGIAPK